jgi:multimeric flavodoxin WrbA
MKKIAVLLGTSRYEGNTRRLIRQLEAAIDARSEIGVEVKVLLLKDFDISPFDYDHNNSGDDFNPLIRQLLEYDHIVFASPLYWYTMSAQLKIFFDRFSDLLSIEKDLGRQLRGQHCSILSTGVDQLAPDCFEQTFKLTFDYLAMPYQGMIYCSFKEGYQLSDFDAQLAEFVDKIC